MHTPPFHLHIPFLLYTFSYTSYANPISYPTFPSIILHALKNTQGYTLHYLQSPSLTLHSNPLFRTISTAHIRIRVQLLQVLLVALGGSLNGRLSGVPVGRADLAVLVGELEGVDEAEGFVYAAADGEVVDCDLFALR